MDGSRVQEFEARRDRGNEIVMRYAGTNVKRFYNIDWQAYREGALPEKTKELLGLVASLVLRCDDCILYHTMQCKEQGVTDQELEETVAIGLVVGGSIVIPHMRRLWEAWDEMKAAGPPV